MLDKIKSVVSVVAPTLAQGLTNPAGAISSIALNAIADKLGIDPKPETVTKALEQPTQAQLLELKKVEQDFKAQMKQLDVDVYKIKTEDIQNARKTFSGDWTSKILGFITIGGFMGYIFLVTIQPPEQNSEALINLVLGYLGGLASAVISFYFGASHNKDE
ncbi:hypothetical protein OA493_03330 [Gammaproteobacteria bacterium]|nr:hypothetical protein [Gammaproteobacteria bacterium]